ncbi:MAG: aldo/keto reductase [Clostridiaceae bacterium]|nr:aldo/keto reductase [Clostridiaceae bacterium]
MEFVILNNGIKMPILGFGVYQITDPEQCEQAVVDAIQTGYRLIDTAASYGNEEAVGRAVKRCGVPREELFITTKLWVSNTNYSEAKTGFQHSLDRLGLDYVDLYLIHQPMNDYYGAWRAMTELYKEKRTRAIGLCNFYPDRLVDLIHFNEVAPAINQIETNIFYQREADLQTMKKKGVQMEAWAPFAEGHNDLFRNETLMRISTKYNKSVAQVVLRWLIQRGIVCIPKSANKERIVQNFNVFDFALTNEDMSLIATLDTGKSTFFDHRNPDLIEALANLKRV